MANDLENSLESIYKMKSNKKSRDKNVTGTSNFCPDIVWDIKEKGVLNMHMMYHTVKAGDTLWKIAHHHHTSIHHLLHTNPSIKNPNLIYIGQRIKIH